MKIFFLLKSIIHQKTQLCNWIKTLLDLVNFKVYELHKQYFVCAVKEIIIQLRLERAYKYINSHNNKFEGRDIIFIPH